MQLQLINKMKFDILISDIFYKLKLNENKYIYVIINLNNIL